MMDRELLSHFEKQSNGMWKVIKPITMHSPNGTASLNVGTSVGPGLRLSGVDVAGELEAAAKRLGR